MEVSPRFGAAGLSPELKIEDSKWICSGDEVSAGARPAVVFRAFDHRCPERILLDVSESDPEVISGKRTGIEAILPKMAGTVALHIESLGIPAVDPPEENSKRIGVFGNGDNVDVIRHEAICEDAHSSVREIIPKKRQIVPAIRDGEKD